MGTPSDVKAKESKNDKGFEKADSVGKKDEEKSTEDGEVHDDGLTKGDEEDVPDDFFDDFSNEDFMDGLDIVDAWDETQKNKRRKEEKEKAEKARDDKQRQRKRSRERRSRERKSRSAERFEREKRRRSEDRRRRSRERRHRENSPPRKRPTDAVDLRRDPIKTKRDVEKDRENYVKKKEQKLISQVVETGLVPPGMETEVNLSEIECKEEKVREKMKKDSVRPEDPKPSRERENSDIFRERRRRSRSFNRVSPVLRGRSRGRSGDRRRERSRGRRDRSRERGRRTRSRERSLNRNRNLSPFSIMKRRRSRSLSDRERWLTKRRSPSPERKYKERIGEERLSFLEELKIKLDGHPTTHSPVGYPFAPNQSQPNYLPPAPNAFPPHPIQIAPPPSNQYFPPTQNSPYDQNFFIGDPMPMPPINHNPMNLQPSVIQPSAPVVVPAHMGMGPGPGAGSQPFMDYGVSVPPVQHPVAPVQHPGAPVQNPGASVQHPGAPVPPVQHPVAPVPPPKPVHLPPATTTGMNNVNKLMEQIRAATTAKVIPTGDAAQLLEEKKLSLTDFLSINSRPSAFSSCPEALHKKVNVLSRCQDILKELTGNKRFGGKLTVTKTSKNQDDAQLKNVSPLLRREPVRFSYSTPAKFSEKSTFLNVLNKALVKTKLIPEIIEVEDDEKPPETIPPAPRIRKQKGLPFSVASKPAQQQVKRMLMKMCQTDPLKCEECELRKEIKYNSTGIQCGESERYNVGVQVVEADIINSRIPKNQSLAYLTPAQLLGRGDPTSTKVDNFSSPYGRSQAQSYLDYQEYRDRPRGYAEADTRRMDFDDSPYPSSAMRDPQRFPRY